MTHIKRLKLKGFKSFANPTVLTFEEGFNTIVGANGSGKSNVFDALCFVLGRMSSKGLRADKLGNLVFNGGKGLKGAKEAEVDLFLSNDKRELIDADIDEIKLSRVVKKSGASNYYLNNNKVTRTQIVEMLKRASIDPDGYNIILQGDITKIVNMSSIERRELIEDISNISGYEEKREKAMKKLEQVETDLKDADLLMAEKTKYLKDLKSEKEQAEKYHSTREDLRFNHVLLLKAKHAKNSTLKLQKEEDLKKKEEELEKERTKLDEIEKEIKTIDDQITNFEKQIELESRSDFVTVTNRITQLESSIQNLKEKKADLAKQLEEVKTRNQGLKVNIQTNKKQIAEFEANKKKKLEEKKVVDAKLKEVDKKLDSLKGGFSGDMLKDLEVLEQEIEDLQSKKLDKNHLRTDNAVQVEKLNTKIEHLQGELDSLTAQSTQNKEEAKQLESCQKNLKKLILDLSTKTNKHSETSARLHALSGELDSLRDEHLKLSMREKATRDVMATNKAVDTILQFKAQDKAIHGSVAELARVPPKYTQALETIAGRALFNIVIDSDQSAVKYINYLKDNKVGKVTFLPLNKIKSGAKLDTSVLSKKGVIDYALNLIEYDPQYETVFKLVFSDTLVIESIEHAKAIGIGQYRMVTLDGDIVQKSGAMSGGFKSKKSEMGAFKDSSIAEKLEKCSSKLMKVEETHPLLKDEKTDLERGIYELREQKMEVESEVAKLEKLLKIEGKDPTSIREEMNNLLGDKAVVDASLKKIDKELSDIDTQISKAQDKKNALKEKTGIKSSKAHEIESSEEEKEKLRAEVLELTSAIDTYEVKITSVLVPEISSIEKLILENEKAKSEIEKSIENIKVQLVKEENELKENKKKEGELSKNYKGLIEQRDKLKEKKGTFEAKYSKVFEGFDKIKEKVSHIRYSMNEYDTLNESILSELEVVLEEIKTEFVEHEDKNAFDNFIQTVTIALEKKNLDTKDLQQKVNTLKSRLASFGSINMKAVEIYDKLNEEFTALLEKRETLNVERNEIVSFIEEIDEKKKEEFMKTFTQLREHFINIFSKLSTKGQVELNLENEKDLFNSGVEIRVRLSQKNYLDIKSLSGGEKTITAIAFIFAVQEFNPASFYIFDEVDAALDIMNAEKLGKLIKENAHKAQYVAVSHSEHFIQSSESIYGVTMNNSKISDVLSLDLSQMKDYVDE